MAITKLELISAANKAFQCSEASSSTLFDEAILMALADLSKLEILRDVDTTQSLVAGDSEIEFPSDLLPGGMISITLTDANGNAYEPLLPMRGGMKEYRYLLDHDTTQGRPEYYTDGDGDKWYIWRTANTAYTVRVEYFKTHPSSVAAILFPDVCRSALKMGMIYFESVLRRNEKYQATWAPMYAREYQAMEGMFPGQVRGTYDA